MQINAHLTDDAVLEELGARLRRHRLALNLTQEQLATEAGVSRPTVGRIEAGGDAKLPAFVRVLRALELLEGLEQAIPAPPPSPIQAVEHQGRQRVRARPGREAPTPDEPWRWGDEA